MENILISSCLAGALVRYDGRIKALDLAWLEQLETIGTLYQCCPEADAGMPIPRPAAQIVGGTGRDVLEGRAKVQDLSGKDVTAYFIEGAERSLSIAQQHHIRFALLKEKSPSCGSSLIYDGSFSSRLMNGEGVTAAMLRHNGIAVYPETQIELFAAHLCRRE